MIAACWTVTVTEKNIELIKPDEGQAFEPFKACSNGNKKATFEYTLRYENKKAHVLTGERGKIILEEFAAELNAKRYVPRFEKGKLLIDMSPAQIKKLALEQSPPLPL